MACGSHHELLEQLRATTVPGDSAVTLNAVEGRPLPIHDEELVHARAATGRISDRAAECRTIGAPPQPSAELPDCASDSLYWLGFTGWASARKSRPVMTTIGPAGPQISGSSKSFPGYRQCKN